MLLTVEEKTVSTACLVTFSVIPRCPETPVLQPERCPDRVADTQATGQTHAGLRKPEATVGVPQLQKRHSAGSPRGKENRSGQEEQMSIQSALKVSNSEKSLN